MSTLVAELVAALRGVAQLRASIRTWAIANRIPGWQYEDELFAAIDAVLEKAAAGPMPASASHPSSEMAEAVEAAKRVIAATEAYDAAVKDHGHGSAEVEDAAEDCQVAIEYSPALVARAFLSLRASNAALRDSVVEMEAYNDAPDAQDDPVWRGIRARGADAIRSLSNPSKAKES